MLDNQFFDQLFTKLLAFNRNGVCLVKCQDYTLCQPEKMISRDSLCAAGFVSVCRDDGEMMAAAVIQSHLCLCKLCADQFFMPAAKAEGNVLTCVRQILTGS